MSEHLDILIKLGFVRRDFTWHLKTGKESRLSHFRLSDNYLRFYLKYIDPNRGKIENAQFIERSLSSLSSWEAMAGLQFENLVLNNRKLIWEALRIYPDEIFTDNPFFQRKTSKTVGCQIDYLIQTNINTLYACEIKFSKNPIGLSIVAEMQGKIQALSLPRGFSCVPVLIHVNGVLDLVIEENYFKKIINFGEWLEN